ncbi:MAG: hypothetical protein AAFR76_11965 [Planctomycetota bacterium]
MSEPEIKLDPPAHTWADLIEFDPGRNAEERARFGLPTDRPIIMAGHQGEFWHAGIAAKLFAAQALADRINAAVAWLVIDTDDTKPAQLRVPVRDEAHQLVDRTIRIDRERIDHPGAAAALAAFDRHSNQTSLATRVTLAAIDLLPTPMPTLLRASQLAESAAFGSLVEQFRSDADEARSRYNIAVEANPQAGMTGLVADQIPFWRVTPSGGRLPARERDLDTATLWPRALATTAAVRAALCDLFIHGTGGAAYEPLNDHWLGERHDCNLAPFVSATATLRLTFDGHAVTPTQAHEAKWRAHHARHHPGLIGAEAAQAQRTQLVESIRGLPTGDPKRAELFADLHGLLAGARSRHAGALATLDEEAAVLTERAKEHRLRNDRTWPAALHDPADLEALRTMIDSRFDH